MQKEKKMEAITEMVMHNFCAFLFVEVLCGSV